eukprot:SAG31_NODE_3497_length_4195_cov_5.065430_7_plen_59_part_00
MLKQALEASMVCSGFDHSGGGGNAASEVCSRCTYHQVEAIDALECVGIWVWHLSNDCN